MLPNLLKALPMKRSTVALALALAASPALAVQDYPPGLFENSPVVPSGPSDATVPSGPPDAGDSFGPRDAVDPLDDYCDGLASRTFRSLGEVKRAHARCDHAHSVAPLWPPPRTRQTSDGMQEEKRAATGGARWRPFRLSEGRENSRFRRINAQRSPIQAK